MAVKEKETHINIKNRKASHEYQFIDIYQAGIVLTGTEIKSVRDSKVSLSDAFCNQLCQDFKLFQKFKFTQLIEFTKILKSFMGSDYFHTIFLLSVNLQL